MQVSFEGAIADAARLLHNLYHNTRPLGFGMLHNKPDFSLVDAQDIIDKIEKDGRCFDFDYVHGRPIKVRAAANGVINDGRLYNRDAGPGRFEACFLVSMEL